VCSSDLLLHTDFGIRAFGAGIVSSHSELQYSLQAPEAERRAFDVMTVLRTPYRIDILQPVYYVLENFAQLFEFTQIDLISLVKKARALGNEAAHFEPPSA
jgi:phenylalanine-4-hydroxylase